LLCNNARSKLMRVDESEQRCGRLDDQISLLKHKLQLIHQGHAFNGKRTKTARSQGRKFQVTLEQEATRLLVRTHTSSHGFVSCNANLAHLVLGCVCREIWGGR
jgi:hypothetical protein